jgi:CheY-like chemotaxis protein
MKRAISGSVLVVEDSPTRIDWFRERLPHATIATTPLEAVEALRYVPDVVFLDFDLGAGNSLGVASLLADAPPNLCVIHSANEEGAAELKSLLPAALVLPFASFTIEGK